MRNAVSKGGIGKLWLDESHFTTIFGMSPAEDFSTNGRRGSDPITALGSTPVHHIRVRDKVSDRVE